MPDSPATQKSGCVLRLALPALSLLLLTLLALLAVARIVCLSCKESALPPSAVRQEQRLATRLRQDVEALCARPRYGDETTRRQAVEYISERLRRAGWQVRLRYFTVPPDPEDVAEGATAGQGWRSAVNIIATHPCAASGKAAEGGATRYIIGAHYDACDTDEGNPGADDNASACAALLALADMLAPGKVPAPGKATPALELVFYDCEEPPWFGTEWMGSAQHASTCTTTDSGVLGMVCLEMLGYYSDEPGSQPSLFPGSSLLLPTQGNFIAIAGNMNALSLARRAQAQLQRGMPALRLNAPFAQETGLFFSDHRNYAAAGIPAIMVTDTAMLRNPHYHEPTDTAETLDYPRFARVTLNLARFLRALISH